jgi:hypothetical protein
MLYNDDPIAVLVFALAAAFLTTFAAAFLATSIAASKVRSAAPDKDAALARLEDDLEYARLRERFDALKSLIDDYVEEDK